MTNEFVNFKIAKKLKDIGFECKHPFAMYNENGIFHALFTSADYCGKYREYYGIEDFDEHDYICPTISQVLKWLREERDIDIVVEPINGNTVFMSGERYIVSIYNIRKRDDKIHRENKDKYVSWEEAVLGGIQYVIDNLK